MSGEDLGRHGVMLCGRLRAMAQADQVRLDLGHLGDELVGDVGLLSGEAQQRNGQTAKLLDVGASADVAHLLLDLELIREGQVEVKPEHNVQAKIESIVGTAAWSAVTMTTGPASDDAGLFCGNCVAAVS